MWPPANWRQFTPARFCGKISCCPWGSPEYRLAKEIGVSQRRIGEIVQGTRGITVDTALRLAAFFGTDAQSWINLQTRYDTELARESMRDALSRIHRFELAAA
jgi:addiction module HigA family antidote